MFDRGYTGHEHLSEFGLINMNGRVYDPLVSRFLSPDPYIQAPGYTQSYNRYGYVFNNPLKYIDPTGYKSTYYRDWDYSGFTPPPDHGGFGWNIYYNYIAPPLGSGISSIAGNFGNPFSMGGGNWVNSFSGGRLRPPGFGINGPGFGGVYYDWYSATYQSTNGLGQLHWRNAYDVLFFHKENPDGITLPPINVIGSGRYGSGRIIGGVPKWWGDHPARWGSWNASNRGGHGVDDYAALGFGAVGTYYGFMGDAFYSKYHHMQKNGTIRSAKFAKNNPNRIYQTSRNGVKALTKNARALSRGTGIVGSAISIGQFVYEPTYANAFDGVMGATAFIPVVGWAVSGTYFIANTFTTAITGETIGEHIFGDKRVY
jgi:RHS repeat-associated protein